MTMDVSASGLPEIAAARDAPDVAPCAFTLLRPLRQSAPVVVASPHSGRDYDAGFLAASRLDALALRKSEDSFVDDLCAAAPEHGVPLLAAMFPRAFCDVNREAWELDPAMFEDSLPDHVNSASARVVAGLGTIARVVASGEPIYRRKLRFAEARARIETCWLPYHAALAALIAETRAAFGACLLLDVHSMPSQSGPSQSGPGPGPSRGGRGPDIVLGDAHGAACARPVVHFVEAALRGEGFVVRRNDPYAGGYVTRHYGRPRERVHVLQIEIAKQLYMDERTVAPNGGFAEVRACLGRMIGLVADTAARLV